MIEFLIVRIDETLKRLEKRKKDRGKRAHRKARAAPAAPQPSVAQQMMGEAAPAPDNVPSCRNPAAFLGFLLPQGPVGDTEEAWSMRASRRICGSRSAS